MVVVDNLSTDGSRVVLSDMAKTGRLKLIEKMSSRGAGRQAALESATGEYIVSGLDMDDLFRSTLKNLLGFYHEKCEGNLLLTEVASIVAPRSLLLELGGWNDLQYNENWELCRRAWKAGRYVWTIFPLIEATNEHVERRNWTGRVGFRYLRVRDNYRVGHNLFGPNEQIGIGKRAIQTIAVARAKFLKNYREDGGKFTVVDRRHFVDSSGWWPEIEGLERIRRKNEAVIGMSPRSESSPIRSLSSHQVQERSEIGL